MTTLGKIVFGLLILVLIGTGVFVVTRKAKPTPPPDQQTPAPVAAQQAAPAAPTGTLADLQKLLVETKPFPERLTQVGTYQPKDNTIEIELSEYAGYAGLIAYNGGLAPNPDSLFTKKTGFKLKISISEAESWPALNAGKMAASATTTDVLAVYGKQFQVVVPCQISFSRGADGITVRKEIGKFNDLKGKILVASQFTEADFFARYLGKESGISVNMMADLASSPDPDKINLVYAEDAFKAGDVFNTDMKLGTNRLAGCVTWSPKTEEVVDGSDGRARILTTNRNLLIVADILIVNKGFATEHPEMVQALVTGVMEGNRMVQANIEPYAAVIAKALKWEPKDVTTEMKKVHLCNLPENLAFFSGSIDSAGSFEGIYQSAVLAYGSGVIKTDTDPSVFVDLKHLKALEQSGQFKDQKVAIAPIKIGFGGQSLEGNPLLSKDIRFFFEPNSTNLDFANPQNTKNFEDIKRLLQISPGSTILLRGHVDDAQVEVFRQRGGDQFVNQMALKAIALSKERAESVRKALVEKSGLDNARLSTVGKGWEEPVDKSLPTDNDDARRSKSEKNRRVEAVWITIE